MIYTNLNNSGEVESVYAAKRATTTGTPPLSYPSKGYDLEDFLITGNTVQNGTPSPDYPVNVRGVGERTENLFDKDTTLVGYRIYGGSVTQNSSYSCSDFIDVRGLQSIAKNKPDLAITTFYFYDSGKQYINKHEDHNPATIPSDASYVRVNMLRDDPDSFVLVSGTTAPSSYVPYGYKIPVTVGNTTTPIYLGTVQTTRKVKKLVLTGSESYTYQSQYSRYVFTVQNAFADDIRQTQCFCTHYQSIHNGEPIDDVPDKSIYINYQALGAQFCIKDEELTSIADFKSYLAAQYANGTPITIWYILTATETAIVNESLHRIGIYADTISLSQSGITVSTIAGTNTITTETTILPSSISVTTPEKEVSEIYAGINYQNPIFYSRKMLVGTSPLTFKALGQPLKDYHIFGETVQNGTPSPDFPVEVQGVGEWSESILDLNREYYNGFTLDTTKWMKGASSTKYAGNAYLVDASITDGKIIVNSKNAGYGVSVFIPAKPNTKYSIYWICNKATEQGHEQISVSSRDSNGNATGVKSFHDPSVYTTESNAKYLNVVFRCRPSYGEVEYSDILICESDTLVPYGYKIQVTVGNVTTPIYIGSDLLYRVGEYADEIASDGTLTRRNDIIDILADTSKISYVGWFRKNTPYEYRCFRFNRSPGVRKGTSNCFLTHNTYYDGLRGPGEVTFLYADSYFAINFSVPAHIDTVEKCVQWLTDIYESTGKRPVFVCPISTPTTEQVTVPSLSTIVGDNTLTVDTTVKPSAISITDNIKLTGYGQLLDINDVDIQDKNNESIFIQG